MIQTLLKEFVSIPSHAPQEGTLSRLFQQILKDLHFSIQTVDIGDKRHNILATRGTSKQYPLFYGHIDTVSVVRKEEWHTDPYAVVQKGDSLYGLGTYDMKGGIAAVLEALEQTTVPAKVLLCVDEEEISEGAWSVIQQKKEFFSDVNLIISAEPNFDLGLNAITTGRTGRCLFETVIQGKSAHIAKYTEGIDAIELSTRTISKLYEKRDEWNKQYGTVIQIRQINGESVGMSVCASVSLVIEAIIGVNDSIEALQKRISDTISLPVALKSRKTPYLSSYQYNSFPYSDKIKQIIQQYTNQPMTLHTRQSVGDDNVLATVGIPVITWGPDGGNAHAPNEYVSFSSLQTLTAMYQEVLIQAYS
jgi:acetylornithine deacetylase/succinyl-diaminopimelate desuccinylase-like protein